MEILNLVVDLRCQLYFNLHISDSFYPLTWKLDDRDPTNVLSLSHTLTISDWFPGIHRKVIVKWQTALQKLVYSLKSYIYLPMAKFHIPYVGKHNLMGIRKCQSFPIQIVQVTANRNLQEETIPNNLFKYTSLSTHQPLSLKILHLIQ